MADELQQIINPDFTTVYVPAICGTNIVQCNKSKNVYKFIHTGKNYVIELPETRTILNVKCELAALNAADMKIISVFVNGAKNFDCEDYIFSYEYEHFDAIHYTSFGYREKCIVYVSIDDLF
jgi:hypothetical protein